MALRDHLKFRCQIDGIAQVMVTRGQATLDSGAIKVETLEGLVGKTPGATSIEITGDWAVPTGGLEFDFLSACNDGTYHEIQIPVGTKTIVAQGWFQTAGIQGGATESTSATMTFTGAKPEIL